MKTHSKLIILEGLRHELGVFYTPTTRENLIIDHIAMLFEQVEHLIELLHLPLKNVIESCLSFSSLVELLNNFDKVEGKNFNSKETRSLRKEILKWVFDVEINLIEQLMGRAKSKKYPDSYTYDVVTLSLASFPRSGLHLNLLKEGD